jgi:hypothetical protein
VAGSGLTAIVYLGTSLVVVAFVGVALWGVATAVIAGPSRTLLQRASPERAHGRVLAADHVAGSAAELTGVAVAGVLVGALGVPWTITALGLLVATTALVLHRAHQRDETAIHQRVGAVAVPAGGVEPEALAGAVDGVGLGGGAGGGGSAGAPHPRRGGSADP